MPTETIPARDALGDPGLRRSLEDFVRRRVPGAEVDDVVQTVLCEALASQARPRDPGELKRWLLGIARHKVVDLHRRAHREPPAELPDIEVEPPPIEERELARWAEEQAGSTRDAQKTLAWMAREGEGEKLESIAAEEQVPAARVRQRVSRMRRWMKERWLAELAAVAALGLLLFIAWRLLRKPKDDLEATPVPTISPEPRSPLDRARSLRADALEKCERGAWQPCLEGLDQARALDPIGDQAPEIGAARARAQDALRGPAPEDSSEPKGPKAAPTSSAPLDGKKLESDGGSSEVAPGEKGAPAVSTAQPTFGKELPKRPTPVKPSGKSKFEKPDYDYGKRDMKK